MATVADLPGRWTYKYRPQLAGSGDPDGWKTRLAFETDFSNLSAFVGVVAGKVTKLSTSYGGMARVVTLQHPLFNNLWANAVAFEATGSNAKIDSTLANMYSRAVVTVDFISVKYPVAGDSAYLSWDIDQGAQYTTVPGRQFAFPTGEPVDQDAGVWAVRNSYALTLYQCPTLGDDVIDELSGTVNLNPFMGKPAGQLLFGGCKSNYSISMAGVTQIQKTLAFAYQSYPWNQAMRRDGVLDTPLDPNGDPMYELEDFNKLLA